jgi:hypothetical protein
LGCAAVAACGPSMGPKVRVATATAEELRKVEDEDNVWYEFQAGDVIPIQLAFMGVVEGGSREAVFRAKQHFYFVMFKNAPMQISFDGKTFAGPRGSQSLIGVVPREDGKGGKLGWFIYMGEEGDPKAELARLIEDANKSDAEAPAAPAQPEPGTEPPPEASLK